jgi:hypothetical protein
VLRQQTIEIDKRLDRRMRATETHPGASRGIEHPGRDQHGHARFALHQDDIAASTPLGIQPAHWTPEQRVPTIVDLNFLFDTGRITLRLLWAESHGNSADPTAAASARRRYTV